ncbi:MAG: glycosyl hydrolase [Chloroflexi bacterium]|nr:glycosyl hydrolase [Chloroflexota bacterium]
MTNSIFGAALRARLIGPHRGGRVTSVAGHPTQPQVFYFGHCAGGVWKTSDGGRFWTNISDGFFRTGAVGALAVAESDPNVLYAGMGECNIRGNVSHGDGVYGSTDGGRTWRHLGLAETRHIARIRIHPKDPERLYVAAFGHAYGPNTERGVYRSVDGGRTWQPVLQRNNHVGAIDLALDVTNPRVLFAALWEAQRSPHSLSSGGPGSGLFRSTDGGDTWAEITRTPGLPSGIWGRVGVTISPANPDRLWALVEAEEGGLFRSDDQGATWRRITDETRVAQRSWYFMHVFAHPTDPETVWCLNVQAWRSNDGGRAFEAVPTPFEDQHDLWIDPRNPHRIIEGNDGGACVSFNGGATWSSQYNQPTAQFYHVVADDQVPYRVYGAQQDINTLSVPSRSDNAAITAADWYSVGGGESGHVAVRMGDPNTVYAGSFGGHLTCYDHRTGQIRDISVWPDDPMGWGAGELKYRFQWTFPVVASRHSPDVLYATSQYVHRTRDGGSTWQTISPDLTRADPRTLEPSGGPLHKDNVSTEYYATIFAFAESPLDSNILWAGSDDGLLHVSRDGGTQWQNVTPRALPESALFSTIEPSPHHAGTAYVAATRYKLDDFAPYLFRTTDHGASWTAIVDGIDTDDFTRVIREDPDRRGLLYCGTETGVYVSHDAGAHWERLQSNLPVTPIHDLVVKNGDLVVATHGRSFWIFDDVTPLHETVGSGPVHLFKPRAAIRFRAFSGFSLPRAEGKNSRLVGPVHITYSNENQGEALLDAGANPPDGVFLTYQLREDASAKLEVLDRSGAVIAVLDDVATMAGVHRVMWDMRYPAPERVEGATFWEESGAAGPLAPPGVYQLRLTAGQTVLTKEFELLADPRVDVSHADLQSQFELLVQIRDALSETHAACNRITRVRQTVKQLMERDDVSPMTDDLLALDERLASVEAELIQRAPGLTYANPIQLNAKLAALAAVVGSADAAPTQSSREVFAMFSAQLSHAVRTLDELLRTDVVEINNALRALEVPVLG